MNDLRSRLAILTTGIFLGIPLTSNFFARETIANQKTNYHKPLKVDRKIVDSQDILHILIGTRIMTQFSPKDDMGKRIELDKLAFELGYDHFNWVSYVEKDPYGIVDRSGKKLFTPYNDPPMGGYRYDAADRFPFYWDVTDCDRCNRRHHIQNQNNSNQFALMFEDAPADYRLQPGESVEFITSLVGIKNIDLKQNKAEWEILHAFRWKLANPHSNYGRVSLINTNVDLTRLSSKLLDTMVLDGALLSR